LSGPVSALAPLSICDVDLAGPVPALPEGGRGVIVVVWYGDIPLGRFEVDADWLPLGRAAVADEARSCAAAAVWGHLFAPDLEPRRPGPSVRLEEVVGVGDPLAAMAARLRLAEDSAREVSVVVCTRDRPEALARCLDGLGRLDPPPREIVVVDNGPTGPGTTRDVVRDRRGIRYVAEPEPGLAIARNAGIRATEGAVVAFTDDDVDVHPTWAGRLGAVFRATPAAAAAGLVLPAALDTEAQVLFEREWTFVRGFRPLTFGPHFFEGTRTRGVPSWEIGAGMNMAFRRSVVDAVGGFDERLDVGAAGSNGESELWFRLLAAGHRIRYEPTAVVWHHHAREMDALMAQVRAHGRGHAAAALVQFEDDGGWGNLRHVLLGLPRTHVRMGMSRLIQGGRPRARTLPHEVMGYGSGLRYYARHRRRRPVGARRGR
jgi:GT2 family glycosyltransferase